MAENDKDFRAWVQKITYGRYKPPAEDTALSILVKVSAKIDIVKEKEIRDFLSEDILPSVAGDIWSEDGKSLYALLVYFINANFEMREILLNVKKFSDVDHTGSVIEHSTLRLSASESTTLTTH